MAVPRIGVIPSDFVMVFSLKKNAGVLK